MKITRLQTLVQTDSRSIVIVGETGSGKTTQLPQYLIEQGLSPIVVTQVFRSG